nr:glycoside hydrolase, family 32 [Tanacetum cinerariifolium]
MAFHEVSKHLHNIKATEISDDHRTGYHFQPKQNWINDNYAYEHYEGKGPRNANMITRDQDTHIAQLNLPLDPNAPMFYKGIYHLFYQYTPKGSVWGNIVWAHSVSQDLVNWSPIDPAIEPSESFDRFGCWSGSATILPDEKPVILYTGIINEDPKPGKYDTEQDKYIPDEGMIDGWAGLRYDWGNFYASKSFFDPQRTVGSSGDGLTSLALRMKMLGKDGLESRFTLIPGTVWLDPSGKQLLLWPIAELETLRDQNVQLSNMELKQGDKVEVEGITAAQADVDVVFIFPGLDKAETYDTKWDEIFPPETLAENICQVMGTTVQGGLGPFGILTLTSKDFEEYTPVFFRVFNTHSTKRKVLMCSDAMRSTLNNQEYKPSFGGFVDVDLADNKISLRTSIDHSVVESFAAGGKDGHNI